jgi:large subunit ribosomal protein L29
VKAGELRKLNDKELRERLTQAHQTIFDLRSQAETEKLAKPSEVTKAKRDIARILMILGERERAAKAAAAPN